MADIMGRCRCGCPRRSRTTNVGGEPTGCVNHLDCSEYRLEEDSVNRKAPCGWDFPHKPHQAADVGEAWLYCSGEIPNYPPREDCWNSDSHGSHEWLMDGKLRYCDGLKPTAEQTQLCDKCGCARIAHVVTAGHLSGERPGCGMHPQCAHFVPKPDAGDAATQKDFDAALKAEQAERETASAGAAPGEPVSPAEELSTWWVARAMAEVDAVVSKMTEYGGGGAAVDLIEIGRTLAMAGAGGHVNGTGQDLTDAQHAELGVYFYLVGKVARWTAAIVEGRQVSDDTLYDIGIYVRMAQRIRQAGGWPNA